MAVGQKNEMVEKREKDSPGEASTSASTTKEAAILRQDGRNMLQLLNPYPQESLL
jgi:hypothetical protein